MTTQHTVQLTKRGDYIVRSPRHSREIFRTEDFAAAQSRAAIETERCIASDERDGTRAVLRESIIAGIGDLSAVYVWQKWRNETFSEMRRYCKLADDQRRADRIQASTHEHRDMLIEWYDRAVVADTALKNALYISVDAARAAIVECVAVMENRPVVESKYKRDEDRSKLRQTLLHGSPLVERRLMTAYDNGSVSRDELTDYYRNHCSGELLMESLRSP